MLALLRKHQYGLMLILAIVIIIAFTFWDQASTNQGPVAAGDASIQGQTFRPDELGKISRGLSYAQTLGIWENTELSRLALKAGGQWFSPQDYLVNTIVVRGEAEKRGIHVSEDEILDYITQEMTSMQTNGAFDKKKWEDALENLRIKPTDVGRKQEIYDVIADTIRLKKLFALVGADYAPTPQEVEWEYNTQYVQNTAGVVEFDRTDYEDVEITDEEIKDYHTNNTVMSDEKRKLKYILIKTPSPFDIKDLNEAAKKEAENKPKVIADKVQRSLVDYEQRAKEGSTFESIAGAFAPDSPVKETDLFAGSEPPEELKNAGPFLAEAFRVVAKSDNDRIGVPVEVRGQGWYVFEVTERVDAKELNLEEATEKIKTLLTEKKSNTKLKETIDVFSERVTAAVKGGTSFVEAAKAEGKEAKMLPSFSQKEPLTAAAGTNGPKIAGAVAGINPGEVSEPILTKQTKQDITDQFIVVFSEKKELPDDPKMAEQKKTIATSLVTRSSGNAGQNTTFRAWFQTLKEEAWKDYQAYVAQANAKR